MRIVIIADDIVKEGGTKEIIKHIKNAVDNHEICIEYVSSEKYLPKYLPNKWRALFRIIYLNRISNANFSQFDIAISLQPDSHCIRHRNHIVYFQHHIKQYYDLFWQFFRQKRGLRKKMVFLLLTAITRLGDKIYLTPNLKAACIIVNSHTVGERLRKYNGITNYSIINPGCDRVKMIPSYNESIIPNNLQKNNDHHLLLAFSRLNVMQKGIDIILDTATIMPYYDFVIAGPYDATIRTIDKNRLDSNVKLIIKEFSENEKSELFNKCDVFLAPYIEEDFGITPLEANAYGKPVVYCDDSGEIVRTQKHKDTGFMCKRSPQEIAKAIEYCIRNKEHMKTSCIDNASKYSWHNFESSFRTYVNTLKIQ